MNRRLIAAFGLVLIAACSRQSVEAPSPQGSVAVGGGELWYRQGGTGEPVLLIHGSVIADGFAPLLGEPALADYRLITYHRRGYGSSSRVQAPFTIEQQAADAFAVLDRLGVRKAHVVGHSYGGAIALQMAASQPDRVASLALLEPAVFEMSPAAQATLGAMSKGTELHARGDDSTALATVANALVGPGAWEGMAAAPGGTAMQAQAIRDAGTFFDVEMPAAGQWRFTFADVAKVRVPVLNVAGAASIPMFQETYAAIERVLPGAESIKVAGSTHELQQSHPRAVAEALAAFLKRHPL